jgi:futalosine hydrolase
LDKILAHLRKMNILLVSATEGEICPLLQHLQREWRMASGGRYERDDHKVKVLITGVGMVAAAYCLGKELGRVHYDLALQVGVAGAFDRGIALAEVVLITSEQFGDFGAEDHDDHLDIFDMALLQCDTPPYADGRLNMPMRDLHKQIELRRVNSLTVNKVSGNQQTIDRLAKRYSCQVESMEGAAFYYACLLEQVPAFAQIRSISNYIIPRDKAKWKMKEAIEALNTWLIGYLAGTKTKILSN